MQALISLYRNAYSGLGRDIWMLGLVAFINRAGTMVLPFLTLYYTLQAGFSEAQAGFLLLVYGSGSFVGSYIGGRLCASLGNIPMLMVSLLTSGLAFGAFPFVHGYLPMMVASFVIGFCSDSFRPAILSAFSEYANEGTEARAFGFLRMALHSGMAFGPAIGGLLAARDYRFIFWGDGLTCFLAGLAVPFLFSLKASAQKHAAAKADRQNYPDAEPLRDLPYMLFMVLVLGLAVIIFQFMATYPLYLNQHYQLSEAKIGLLVGFNAVILVTLEMVVVHRLEHHNPLKIFGPGVFLTALGFAVLPFGATFGFALVAMGIFSIGEMLALPFSNTLVALRAGPNSGPYMGIYSAMFSLAVMIAPPVGLWLYFAWGAETFWYFLGAVGALVWIATWCLDRFTRWDRPKKKGTDPDSIPAAPLGEPVSEV